MTELTAVTALLLGILVSAGTACADDEPLLSLPDDECPVIDVMTYDPYVDVHEHCLPPPLGQG